MSAKFTPGPWEVCQHLKSIEDDVACSCGYRGVIFGPDHDVAFAICQPGHDPAPKGEEGTEPARYPREVEIANAHLIAAAPELFDALSLLLEAVENGLDTTRRCAFAKLAIAKARGEQA